MSDFERSSLDWVAAGCVPEQPAPHAESSRCRAESPALRQRERASTPSRLAGRSPALARIRTQLQAAAGTRCSVLITGETGTGKSLLAREIHRLSPRPQSPFVQLDCASLHSGTLASELFGHERGAFTGAVSRRIGRLELAGLGTLFLDEIGELDPALQVNFLRVLQERTFERVGGNQTHAFKARVIAATNRDLRREVTRKNFRSDLFFRLNVLHLHMPPLRERPQDLPMLAEVACARLSSELDRARPELEPCFARRLSEYDWPGNVRELNNVMERCLVASEHDRLRGVDLECALRDASFGWEHARPPTSLAAHVADASREDRTKTGTTNLHRSGPERETVRKMLLETGGNVSRAARRLGLSRGTLRYRISAWGLEPSIPRD